MSACSRPSPSTNPNWLERSQAKREPVDPPAKNVWKEKVVSRGIKSEKGQDFWVGYICGERGEEYYYFDLFVISIGIIINYYYPVQTTMTLEKP